MGEGPIVYEQGHAHNEDCRWLTTCETGVPTLTFSSFDTEANYDYVTVYDGANIATAARIGRFHGVRIPPLLVGSGDAMGKANAALALFQLAMNEANRVAVADAGASLEKVS